MSDEPGSPVHPAPQTRFSADGYWWWDGAEWKVAVSADRLWRWDGRGWVPAATAPARNRGSGLAVAIIAGVFLFVLLAVAVITALLIVSHK